MIVADMSVQPEIDSIIEKIPSLDGLVNNAGITHRVPFTFIKWKIWITFSK